MFTCVLIGDSNQNLQELWILILFLLIFGLNPKINRYLFFSPSPVQILWIFFPSSSQSFLCDRVWIRRFQWWIRAWIVGEMVQWWRFSVKSLRTTVNSTEFRLNLILEKLGFMHCSVFLWISGFFVDFDRNWIKRESLNLLVVTPYFFNYYYLIYNVYFDEIC